MPLTVAPLDATVARLVEPLRRRIFDAGTPLTRQLHALYLRWGKDTPVLFDPVALTLSFNERFCTFEDLRLEVDAGGFTREVPGQPNAGWRCRSAARSFWSGMCRGWLGRAERGP